MSQTSLKDRQQPAEAPLSSCYTTITIDGDFLDWTGVPVLDSDGGDNSGGPDIATTQIANDDHYLYIRNTFANDLSLGTFVSIDVDENAATGFDILSLGLVGAEVSWQNDFGFSQATGLFNDGVGLTGEFFGGGHALLDAFVNSNSRELAISLANMRADGSGATFPDDTIRLIVWTNLGVGAETRFQFWPKNGAKACPTAASIRAARVASEAPRTTSPVA